MCESSKQEHHFKRSISLFRLYIYLYMSMFLCHCMSFVSYFLYFTLFHFVSHNSIWNFLFNKRFMCKFLMSFWRKISPSVMLWMNIETERYQENHCLSSVCVWFIHLLYEIYSRTIRNHGIISHRFSFARTVCFSHSFSFFIWSIENWTLSMTFSIDCDSVALIANFKKKKNAIKYPFNTNRLKATRIKVIFRSLLLLADF